MVIDKENGRQLYQNTSIVLKEIADGTVSGGYAEIDNQSGFISFFLCLKKLLKH